MTADLFGRETADDLEIMPARKVTGLVSKVYATPDADDFQTRWTAALKLGFEGIAGDRHADGDKCDRYVYCALIVFIDS